jgi:pimeloyl-ACP methyl ester carboxylesterase
MSRPRYLLSLILPATAALALAACGSSSSSSPARPAAPLIVHGREDRLIPKEHAEAYHDGVVGSRLVHVEDAGHLLPLEKPAELVRLITDFSASGR